MTAAKKVICTAAAPVFITSHRVGSAPGTNRTGRRLLSLALWAFVLHTPTLAQLDSALSLFPLEVGNVWQYHEFYRNLCEPEPFSQYFFVRVTGDSLMPDERRYRHLEGMSALYRGLSYSDLYWMDSATACLFSYQGNPALQDSFLAMPGDQISNHKLCLGVDTATVLGIQTTTKTFEGQWVWELPKWTYASGIGLMRKTENADEGTGCPIGWVVTQELVYARIGGREYDEVVGVIPPVELPETFILHQNYPNPFNPITTIEYTLPHAGYATLKVYNALGEEEAALVDGPHAAGTFKATWDAADLPSGVYFYRLTTGEHVKTRKMVLVR